MRDFEKLGVFYLGRRHDLQAGETTDEPLLYDTKDLTTHAVCVGMTGSGKTGLCLSLLEEAGIDGIPAIVIDPKGDLGNLLLTFPNLAAEEFLPWVDESVALREGQTAAQYAAAQAKLWRDGLAQWGQDGERIARFREAVDLAIYTPGGDAGLPLTVLKSFAAPPAAVIEDRDAFSERISSAASGLLALLGIDADPVRSREHILIANILDRAWRAGRSLDLAALIREIQSPPFETVGILDLESFFPAGDRGQLAMTLNNLLASPSFGAWMQGESLNAQRLLYTASGKPRISVISIAHLSDAERMFFVTILLNEVLTWMRSQPGTSTLRALLYMDEVFGFFPPTANPPSKKPMLTLLKQARAYGLGVVLATQNPVDLDYKGLSNTGTWFLGRLQTERDKARVLEGLEGASAQAGSDFDRGKMEAMLAGMGRRVFLMSNAHEDAPVVFHTRWALSYLRGPLTRTQIQRLMASRRAEDSDAAVSSLAASAGMAPPPTISGSTVAPAQVEETAGQPFVPRPPVPAGVKEQFVFPRRRASDGGRIVYRPALQAAARLHFVRATYKVDVWREHTYLAAATDDIDNTWNDAESLDEPLDVDSRPDEEIAFGDLPSELTRKKTFTSLRTDLKAELYRSRTLPIWKCVLLKTYSQPGESEEDFRIRLGQHVREKRDLATEKLKKKYASKFRTINDRIQTAQRRIEREKAQYRQKSVDSAISIGASVLGAMFGRKLKSATNVTRASSSMKKVGRAVGERTDIAHAEEQLKEYQTKLANLEAEFEEQSDQIEDKLQVENLELEELSVRPRKSDIDIGDVVLVWTPWSVDKNGIAEPAY
ncbi:MAG: ATP-binding protein [Pirellulaceae bacterium]|nr:ATP-binding protein [Pirellulaceae bacterium]MDP7017504.1 ATP-binding protein [Pirellulaceae bacterium]